MKSKELFSNEIILKNKELIKELINDSNQVAVYVTDESYRLLDFNEELAENFPNAKKGEICYVSLRGCETPCRDCLRNKTGVERHTVRGSYYDDIRKCTVSSKMSPITWSDAVNAYLVRSVDRPLTDIDKSKSFENSILSDAFKSQCCCIMDVDFINDNFNVLFGSVGLETKSGSLSKDFIGNYASKIFKDDLAEFTQFIMIPQLEEYEGPFAEKKIPFVDYRAIDKKQNYNWYRVEKYTRGREGQHFILAFKDVKNEKQLQLDYNYKMSEALRVANIAVETKNIFLSNIASGIRTPMNNIMGMVSIARKNYEDQEKLIQCLEQMEESAKSMLGLMTDILDLSKLETGKMLLEDEEFSLRELLKDISESFKEKLWKAGIDYNMDISLLDYDHFRGDGSKLSQALMNLMENAVKLSSSGCYIELVANVLFVMEDNVGLRFEICDNGSGMNDEELEKLYNPLNYQQIDMDNKTGLGIAIAKNLVDIMNGELKIESQPGLGTKATIDLVLKMVETAQEVHPSTRIASPVKPKDLGGKRILVVEDNPINLDVAIEILQSKGLIVDFAVNGLEAVRKFEESGKGFYTAIVMDIQMPIMNGYEAARKIRTSYHEDALNIPIIATTAMAFEEDVAKAQLSGMNTHLPKPIDFNRLCRVIMDYC